MDRAVLNVVLMVVEGLVILAIAGAPLMYDTLVKVVRWRRSLPRYSQWVGVAAGCSVLAASSGVALLVMAGSRAA